MVQPREVEDFPDERIVIVSTGSQGEPLSALRRMAFNDHPQVELARGRHGRLRGDADPRQRARGQRDDRPPLPHRLRRDHGPRRADPRLRPRLRGGDQADAQPRAPALRDALPRRLQAPRAARAPGRGGRRPGREHLQGRERAAARDRREAARASARPSAPGMVFVDGIEIGDVADVALRDRRMLSADGIFIVVATIAEQDGSSVADPEVILRGVPVPGGGRGAARRDPRDRRQLARRARRQRACASPTSSRRCCTTTSRRSSTSACAGGRWCCRSSSRSDRRPSAVAASAAAGGSARRARGGALAGAPLSGRRTTKLAPRGAVLELDVAAVRLRDGAHDRQARARSTPPRSPRAGDEALEDARAASRAGRRARRRRRAAARRRPSVSHGDADRTCPAACGGRRSRSGSAPAGGARRARPTTITPSSMSASSSRLVGQRVRLADRVEHDLAEVERPRWCARGRCPSARAAAGRRRAGACAAPSAARPRRPRARSPCSSSLSSSRFASTLVSGVRSSCEASATNSRWRCSAPSVSMRALSSALEHLLERRAPARRPRRRRAAGGRSARGRPCARSRAPSR